MALLSLLVLKAILLFDVGADFQPSPAELFKVANLESGASPQLRNCVCEISTNLIPDLGTATGPPGIVMEIGSRKRIFREDGIAHAVCHCCHIGKVDRKG